MIPLTIAIPTYNRRNEVTKRVEELLGQLKEADRLLILDNCSTDGTVEALRRFVHPRLEIKSVPANLGMASNIARCFTEVGSGWLWMLGDDDRTASGAVEKCRILVGRNPSAAVINTVTLSCANEYNRSVIGIEELHSVKSVTSLMHISSNLYNLDKLKPSFKILIPAGITMAPHVAMILYAAVHNNIEIHLSQETLLDEIRMPRRYSSIELAVGLSLLPQLLPLKFRERLARDLRSNTRWAIMWALGEGTSIDHCRAWKARVRFCDNCFKSNNASFLSGLSISRKEFLRDLKIQILAKLPLTVLKYCAKFQSGRTRSLRDNICHELT